MKQPNATMRIEAVLIIAVVALVTYSYDFAFQAGVGFRFSVPWHLIVPSWTSIFDVAMVSLAYWPGLIVFLVILVPWRLLSLFSDDRLVMLGPYLAAFDVLVLYWGLSTVPQGQFNYIVIIVALVLSGCAIVTQRSLREASAILIRLVGRNGHTALLIAPFVFVWYYQYGNWISRTQDFHWILHDRVTYDVVQVYGDELITVPETSRAEGIHVGRELRIFKVGESNMPTMRFDQGGILHVEGEDRP